MTIKITETPKIEFTNMDKKVLGMIEDDFKKLKRLEKLRVGKILRFFPKSKFKISQLEEQIKSLDESYFKARSTECLKTINCTREKGPEYKYWHEFLIDTIEHQEWLRGRIVTQVDPYF